MDQVVILEHSSGHLGCSCCASYDNMFSIKITEGVALDYWEVGSGLRCRHREFSPEKEDEHLSAPVTGLKNTNK